MTTTSPKTIGLCIFLFLASALVTLSVRSSHVTKPLSLTSSLRLPGTNPFSPPTHPQNEPRVAFATFLAGDPDQDSTTNNSTDDESTDAQDGYFLGARVLAYALLHSPVTGTNASIPFLVLVTPDVSARKRARLTLDGATVIPVPKIDSEWVHPAAPRWRDVMAKLRLWELDAFTKICFVDADTLVTRRLDGVFWDEATLARPSLHNVEQIREDEDRLPRTYMLASHADYFGYDHAWPPDPTGGYLNCGFFVFQPDRRMFAYYMSLLKAPGTFPFYSFSLSSEDTFRLLSTLRLFSATQTKLTVEVSSGKFDPSFPEQNLLNYAHRRDGNMPWQPLWYGWNVNWPTERDLRGGAASFHAKYWDDDPTHDPVLKAIWREQRAEMEGFWRGREGGERRIGGGLGVGM